MTAAEFLAKFPESEPNEGLLEDIGCPECGQRTEFRIQSTVTATVVDDSADTDESDTIWEHDSICRCSWDSEVCEHEGTVADFTFQGLDDLIAAKAEAKLIEGKEEE